MRLQAARMEIMMTGMMKLEWMVGMMKLVRMVKLAGMMKLVGMVRTKRWMTRRE